MRVRRYGRVQGRVYDGLEMVGRNGGECETCAIGGYRNTNQVREFVLAPEHDHGKKKGDDGREAGDEEAV